MDEHLGEVAVLEERDVGGAADRGVELLRERGLGVARAGAEGDVDVEHVAAVERRHQIVDHRDEGRALARVVDRLGAELHPRGVVGDVAVLGRRDEEDVGEVAERLALREAVEEGGGGQPLVLQRELGEAARLEGKGWRRERRCRARREGGDGAKARAFLFHLRMPQIPISTSVFEP